MFTGLLIVILAVAILNLHRKHEILDRRLKSVEGKLDRSTPTPPAPTGEEFLTPVDIATRAMERHEQNFHKGGRA